MTGVVYGLIGTALAQGLLAGIGFWIAGVPQALLLGCLTFVLSFVPAGPPFVWGPVALWLFMQESVWWGIFVAIWGLLLVSSIDNFLRPYLLGKNTNLPVLLGLFGLIVASWPSASSAFSSGPRCWRWPIACFASGSRRSLKSEGNPRPLNGARPAFGTAPGRLTSLVRQRVVSAPLPIERRPDPKGTMPQWSHRPSSNRFVGFKAPFVQVFGDSPG